MTDNLMDAYDQALEQNDSMWNLVQKMQGVLAEARDELKQCTYLGRNRWLEIHDLVKRIDAVLPKNIEG